MLALLLYFWISEICDIILHSKSMNKENMANIRNVFCHLNKTIVKNLLLIHTWRGCDTTSLVLIQGKTAIFNLIEKENPEVLDICGLFDNPSTTQEDIGKAGIWLFTVMYGTVCLLYFFLQYLMYFRPMFLHTLGKCVKTTGFLMFSMGAQKRGFICLEWFKASNRNTWFFLKINKINHLLLKSFLAKSNLSNQLSLWTFCMTADVVVQLLYLESSF